MPEITGITPQNHDKTRCNIEADGRFFCGMSLETVVRNRLKIGMTVSDEELSRMQFESERGVAFDKALTHISASAKTEKEIRDFLGKKGYLREVADYVVGKMKEYGYLNDLAYANSYVESAGKKKGRRLIALELRRKGVSEQDIEEALQSSEEEQGARAVLEKYLRGKTIDRKNLQKAFAYLIGKGFSYETAHDAVASLGETDED